VINDSTRPHRSRRAWMSAWDPPRSTLCSASNSEACETCAARSVRRPVRAPAPGMPDGLEMAERTLRADAGDSAAGASGAAAAALEGMASATAPDRAR